MKRSALWCAELDVCVYLMSAVAVQMEVEEGANATVTDLIASLLEEEELALPRGTQVHVFNNAFKQLSS